MLLRADLKRIFLLGGFSRAWSQHQEASVYVNVIWLESAGLHISKQSFSKDVRFFSVVHKHQLVLQFPLVFCGVLRWIECFYQSLERSEWNSATIHLKSANVSASKTQLSHVFPKCWGSPQWSLLHYAVCGSAGVILFCGVLNYTQYVRNKIVGNGQTNISFGNWKIRHLWLNSSASWLQCTVLYFVTVIHWAVLPIYYLILSLKATKEIKHNVGNIHTPFSLMENRHWVLYK